MTPMTPLQPWIAAKIGLPGGESLNRANLEAYQLRKLRETVAHVMAHSPFYRRHLAGCTLPERLEELTCFPFTTPGHITADERPFLSVSQGEIERAVTLYSSGTTAPSKRLHFTADDLELTVDFFHHGMGTMVASGQKVLIFMPGDLPGSVGDLLARGLVRLGVTPIIHGLITDPEAALDEIEAKEVDCLVGLPVQLLGLARHPAAAGLSPRRLKSILVSADYAPRAIIDALAATWDVPVFDHYGMTEMGLGGAVECGARCGYHPREADLLMEIIDPVSGTPVADGTPGEVVFTTLTRRGMPLIRYRTGDLARFLSAPCPCGTVLRRMERISGRIAGAVTLGNGLAINIADLDEALFPLPFLNNFRAELTRSSGPDVLSIEIATCESGADYAPQIHQALLGIPALASAAAAGILRLGPVTSGTWSASPTIKRSIVDHRKEPSC